MKKILILGGAGMLGHKMYQTLKLDFDTCVTFRDFSKKIKRLNIYDEKNVIDGIDAFEFSSIDKAFEISTPDIVINCIGIIKQLDDASNYKKSIYVNSLFPHLLAKRCELSNIKLIHISTDCVFSGKTGYYKETNFADADDLYGRTKYLGEIAYGNTLTIRTSIIGHELFSNVSLIDWFLSNHGENVDGYANAIYSGLPTITLSKEIAIIIKNHQDLSGVYQIASNPISKYDLLNLVNDIYGTNIDIIRNNTYKSDKSLCVDKYISATNYRTSDWKSLVEEMHKDYISNNYRDYKNV